MMEIPTLQLFRIILVLCTFCICAPATVFARASGIETPLAPAKLTACNTFSSRAERAGTGAKHRGAIATNWDASWRLLVIPSNRTNR